MTQLLNIPNLVYGKYHSGEEFGTNPTPSQGLRVTICDFAVDLVEWILSLVGCGT